MTYRLSQKAEADLIDIYLIGVRDFGVRQAELYFSGLAEAFGFLAKFPRAARERAEITPPVRIHPFKSHLIVYRIEGPNIRNLRVRHGHEDWENPGENP